MSHVYFTTKGDNRVWDYDTRSQRLAVLYEAALDPSVQLTGVDNTSELAGPAFDPSGRRRYVRSQRGRGTGIT